MVIAHHLIWTAYGWWLPNDPRGSSSQTIRSNVIADLGELHVGRKRVQPSSNEIREFYERAVATLKYNLCLFNSREYDLVAESFASVIGGENYTCYACAIMPDHVHILIRKHKHRAEDMITNLQEASRLRFCADGLREDGHPVWGGCGWKVFLDTPDDVWRTIRYIEQNPVKIGQPVQRFSFVTLYNDWPFHKKSSR